MDWSINWIAVINNFLSGFVSGTGFVVALVLWFGIIHKLPSKGEKEAPHGK